MMKKLIMTGLILTVSMTFTGCGPSDQMNMGMSKDMDMNHNATQQPKSVHQH